MTTFQDFSVLSGLAIVILSFLILILGCWSFIRILLNRRKKRSSQESVTSYNEWSVISTSDQNSIFESNESLAPDIRESSHSDHSDSKYTSSKPDFQKTFLHPVTFQHRASLYLSANTKQKIMEVIKKIGNDNLTATDYVENIMRHHLNLYRDDINRIHREQNFKNLI